MLEESNLLNELFELIEPCESSKKEITNYTNKNGIINFFKDYKNITLTEEEKSKLDALYSIVNGV